jgi:hypothetical protein
MREFISRTGTEFHCSGGAFQYRRFPVLQPDKLGQTDNSRHVLGCQCLSLISAETRHQGKMIIVSATFVAEGTPRAYIAVLCGFWVGISYSVTGRMEISFDLPKVRDVLLDCVFFWVRVASEHHVHPLGLDSLNLGEEL